MSDINIVSVSGRLVAKPEVKYAKTGTAVCNFSICVSNYDKQAEKKEKPNFFNCVCFGHTAEALVKYRDQGDSIFVAGILQQETWTNKEGQKRTAVKIIVNHIVFGRAKKSEQSSAPAEEKTEPKEPQDLPFDDNPGDDPFAD